MSPEERADLWRSETQRLALDAADLRTQAANLRVEVDRLERLLAAIRPPAPPPAPIPLAAMCDDPWFDSPDAGRGMTAEQQRRAGLRDG